MCVFNFIVKRIAHYISVMMLCFLFAWNSQVVAAPALTNILQGQNSPYLQLHRHDPVAWQVWGDDVLKAALAQHKLIFISVGYFSCYWCHVMQRESFSDKSIARVLNDNFIAVKVDRELNPGLDAYLIEFTQRTRGTAGWPLNVIISPDGYPVLGMTYLPKDQLTEVLRQITQLWQQNKTYLSQTSQQAATQLHAEKVLTKTQLEKTLGRRYVSEFLQQALANADELSGGFGDQSKFPMVPQLTGLLNEYQHQPQPNLKHFLELTLDQMATQALRDHIGGGFYRYTVDPTWQTPHFEKMLYDNAQLSLLYARAAAILDRKDYLKVMRETLNFMQHELLTPQGALASSLSAVDDKNIEGGYYLWDRNTLRALLTETQFKVITQAWGLDSQSRFEVGYLPQLVRSTSDVAVALNMPVATVNKSLHEAQATLFKRRLQRKVPVDTKLLAAWNGLALAAYVEGEKISANGEYRAIAQKIHDYLVKVLWDGTVLHRMKAANGSSATGTLEDYAFAAQGLWQWYLLTQDPQDLTLVQRLVSFAWQHFYDNTGWKLSDRTLLPGYFGSAVLEDDTLPSPSATIINLSIALLQQPKLDTSTLRAKVEHALSIGHEAISANPFYFVTQIEALQRYLSL